MLRHFSNTATSQTNLSIRLLLIEPIPAHFCCAHIYRVARMNIFGHHSPGPSKLFMWMATRNSWMCFEGRSTNLHDFKPQSDFYLSKTWQQERRKSWKEKMNNTVKTAHYSGVYSPAQILSNPNSFHYRSCKDMYAQLYSADKPSTSCSYTI